MTEPHSDNPAEQPAPPVVTASDYYDKISAHMANERTYMSWLRSALSIAAIGMAIAQFVLRDASPAAGLLVAGLLSTAACALTWVGWRQYQQNHIQIETGDWSADDGSSLFLALTVVIGAGIVITVAVYAASYVA